MMKRDLVDRGEDHNRGTGHNQVYHDDGNDGGNGES